MNNIKFYSMDKEGGVYKNNFVSFLPYGQRRIRGAALQTGFAFFSLGNASSSGEGL